MKTEELDYFISRYLLSRNPLSYDIEGAPFKIGQFVKVLENPNNDDTFDIKFAKQIGIVKFFEYDCGCCQTYPEDPMIGIIFTSGKIEEFWKEELAALTH